MATQNHFPSNSAAATAAAPATSAAQTFVDRILYCKECREPFVFTVGEQRFFASKNFTNEPKRCKNCRTERHARDRNRNRGR
jgi:hypothetical protein